MLIVELRMLSSTCPSYGQTTLVGKQLMMTIENLSVAIAIDIIKMIILCTNVYNTH